jgi:hypothetical protein
MNPRFPPYEGGQSKSEWLRDLLMQEFTGHVRRRCEKISELLFRCDPAGINIGSNRQAYDDAARAILPRLIGCHSEEDARSAVHQEICKIFSVEKAGEIETYAAVSNAIWLLWKSAP